jgi:hypothetical protein
MVSVLEEPNLLIAEAAAEALYAQASGSRRKYHTGSNNNTVISNFENLTVGMYVHLHALYFLCSSFCSGMMCVAGPGSRQFVVVIWATPPQQLQVTCAYVLTVSILCVCVLLSRWQSCKRWQYLGRIDDGNILAFLLRRPETTAGMNRYLVDSALAATRAPICARSPSMSGVGSRQTNETRRLRCEDRRWFWPGFGR